MERPDIERIENRLKRGSKYKWMQETALSLIGYIHHLEANPLETRVKELEDKLTDSIFILYGGKK